MSSPSGITDEKSDARASRRARLDAGASRRQGRRIATGDHCSRERKVRTGLVTGLPDRSGIWKNARRGVRLAAGGGRTPELPPLRLTLTHAPANGNIGLI